MYVCPEGRKVAQLKSRQSRWVDIVDKDIRKIMFILFILSWQKFLAITTKFWPQTHPKCIKMHIEGPQRKFSRGRSPNPHKQEGGDPSLMLSPLVCLTLAADFRWTNSQGPESKSFILLINVQNSYNCWHWDITNRINFTLN